MKGAREYATKIRIVAEKGNIGLTLYRKDGHFTPHRGTKYFIKDHFLFKVGEHARGETLDIFLIKDCSTDKLLSQNNSLKIYGQISGQLGWTEEYGFITNNTVINNALSKVFEEIKNEYEEIIRKSEDKRKNSLKNKKKIQAAKIEDFAKLLT